MLLEGGYQIARYTEIPWEDRKNVDGWPRRAGIYCNDEANSLCMRLIDYAKGSTEPRHVHAGSHATTVLKGSAIVDGLTLDPLDVILGPSNEPLAAWDFFYVTSAGTHAPVRFPEAATLLAVTLR